MSKDIETEVWKYAPVSSGNLLVLLALADNADTQSRLAWPGIPSLARRSRLSERQVRRCIKALESVGILSIKANASPLKTNLYHLSNPKEWVPEGDSLDNISPPETSHEGDTHVLSDRTPTSHQIGQYVPSDRSSETGRWDTHVLSDRTPMSSKPSGEPSVRILEANASCENEVEMAVLKFNEIAGGAGWSLIQKLTPSRRVSLRARLKDIGGLAGWELALEKAAASFFLTGRTSKPWLASFDWLVKSQNFTKLMEGNYDNKTGQSAACGDPTLNIIDAAARNRQSTEKPDFSS